MNHYKNTLMCQFILIHWNKRYIYAHRFVQLNIILQLKLNLLSLFFEIILIQPSSKILKKLYYYLHRYCI